MNKILTILLPLTAIIEADMKNMFNSQRYRIIYNNLIALLKQDERRVIVDPSEEDSSILEFKIYWLLCVLCSKNETTQNYLFDNLNLKEVIEINAAKYKNQLKTIFAHKEKIPEGDKKCIGKKVYKFFEFVYYMLINNEYRTKDFYSNCKNLSDLKTYSEERIRDLVPENDLKSDVFNMINKIYNRLKENDY
jgi:hypothetical protein